MADFDNFFDKYVKISQSYIDENDQPRPLLIEIEKSNIIKY